MPYTPNSDPESYETGTPGESYVVIGTYSASSTPPPEISANTRPYDPEVGQALTQRYLDESRERHDTEENRAGQLDHAREWGNAYPAPRSRHVAEYKGDADESMDILNVFSKITVPAFLSREGRIEKLRKKRDKAQHSINVVRVVGESIQDPSGQPWPADGPVAEAEALKEHTKRLTAWTGVHKTTIKNLPQEQGNKGNFGKITDWTMKNPKSSTRPNDYRPVTRHELGATKRLTRLEEKRTRASRDSKWLRDKSSLPLYDDAAKVRLSRSERRHVSSVERRADRLAAKTHRANVKFDKITASEDWRGKLHQRYLKHRQSRLRDAEEKLWTKRGRSSWPEYPNSTDYRTLDRPPRSLS